MRERPDGYLEAESFAEHMTPEVTWITDPEFDAAFDEQLRAQLELPFSTGDTTMTTQASYAQPNMLRPGCINIEIADAGARIVTVRSAGYTNSSSVLIPEDDWNQLMADAARLRYPTPPGTVEAPNEFVGMHYEVSDGATPGDPLGLRPEARASMRKAVDRLHGVPVPGMYGVDQGDRHDDPDAD